MKVSMAKECVTTREGECILEACGEWCFKTYKGHGTCVEAGGDPLQPNYKCICTYTCSI